MRSRPIPAAPNFANTIEAMERSERTLDRVAAVFFNLAGADTNDAIEALQRDLSPRLAAHHSETMMNAALFARVDALMARKDGLGLTPEQERVLTLYHRMFVRAGARLEGAERARLRAVLRAAGEPRDRLRAERAGRREGLDAAARAGRSRWAARRSRGGDGRGGGGARASRAMW